MERLDPKGWQFELKYAADRFLAAFGLLLAAPFLALGALAIRLCMGSPVFFRQERVGLDGATSSSSSSVPCSRPRASRRRRGLPTPARGGATRATG